MEVASIEEIFSDGVSESLVDPILNIIYQKPVVTPSGNTISRSVIIRNGYKDPFTQAKLREDLLFPNRDKEREIDSYLQNRVPKYIDQLARASHLKLRQFILAINERDDLSFFSLARKQLIQSIERNFSDFTNLLVSFLQVEGNLSLFWDITTNSKWDTESGSKLLLKMIANENIKEFFPKNIDQWEQIYKIERLEKGTDSQKELLSTIRRIFKPQVVVQSNLNVSDSGNWCVWIGNLPSSATEEQVEEEFGQFGPVESLKLFPQKNYGLVFYSSKEDALDAFNNISKVSIGNQAIKAKAPTFKKLQSSTPSTVTPPTLQRNETSPVVTNKEEKAQIVPKKEHKSEVKSDSLVPERTSTKKEASKIDLILTKSKVQYLLKFYKNFMFSLGEDNGVVISGLELNSDSLTLSSGNASKLSEVKKHIENLFQDWEEQKQIFDVKEGFQNVLKTKVLDLVGDLQVDLDFSGSSTQLIVTVGSIIKNDVQFLKEKLNELSKSIVWRNKKLSPSETSKIGRTDISSIEKSFGVSVHVSEKEQLLTITGCSRDSVEAAYNGVFSETDSVKFFELSKATLMFIKLRESAKLDDLRKKHNILLNLHQQGITVSGPSTFFDAALQDFKTFLGNIKTVESTKKFNKGQLKLLSKRKLGEFHKKYPSVFVFIEEKRKLLNEKKKQKSSKRGKDNKPKSIILVGKNPKIIEELKKEIDAIYIVNEVIDITTDNIEGIKIYDITRRLEKDASLFVHLDKSQIRLEGIPEDVQKAKAELETLFTAVPKQETITLTLPQYHFLKYRREAKILAIRSQCKLDQLLFGGDTDEANKRGIMLIGNNRSINAAKASISNLLLNFATTTKIVDFEIHKKRDRGLSLVEEKKENIEKTEDVVIKCKKTETGKPILEIEVSGIGVDKINAIAEITSQIAVSFKERVLKPSTQDYNNLFKEMKKSYQFEKEWNVDIFFRKQDSAILITGNTKEDVDSAVEFLELKIKDVQLSSVHIPLDNLLYNFWKFRVYPGIVELAKQHEVRVSLDVQSPLILNLVIKGKKAAVDSAYSVISARIQTIQGNQVRGRHFVEKAYLPILTSPILDIPNKISERFGVSVELPKERNQFIDGMEIEDRKYLEVLLGDITKDTSDVIVNAANAQLSHGGGVAAKISRKAGPALDAACKEFIKKNGALKIGQVVKTTAGNLKFKFIIHSVGPSWTGGTSGEAGLLKQAVMNALNLAESEKVTSISFPAISAGIFNYPVDECAKILVASAFEFFATKPQLQRIRFVDKDPKTVNILVEVLKHFCTPVVKEAVDKSKRSLFDIIFSKKPEPYVPKRQWYWEDDDQSYVPYDPDQNYQIDFAYSQKLKTVQILGDRLYNKNGKRYQIIFSEMKQENLDTHFKRNVFTSDIQLNQYYDSSSNWKIFLDPKSNTLYYRHSSTKQVSLTPPEGVFKKLSLTDFIKKDNYMVDIYDEARKKYQGNVKSQMTKNNTVEVVIRGDVVDVRNAIEELKSQIQANIKKSKVTVDQNNFRIIQELEDLCKRYLVELKYDKDKEVELSGAPENVNDVKIKIMEFQVNLDKVIYPLEWKEQKSNCELFDIPITSDEGKRVVSRIFQTSPKCDIKKIQRIQNKWLWEQYFNEKQKLQKKIENVNEMELFHGTKNTQPKIIYNGEDGFDMRFSNSGMWGQGIYFAHNASYSMNYASSDTDGKQMFLARVLVGETHYCPADNTLRMPPQKSKSNNNSKFQFEVERYDSCSGDTNGSRVYILYENGRAYPFYLITFN